MLFGFILADINIFLSRIGSYTWKSTWGPEYHQSMVISLSGLVLASLLSFGELSIKYLRFNHLTMTVIRQLLVRRNRILDRDEKAAMNGVDRERVEEAARLEGLTFENALERRKGFRYLY